MFKSNYLSQFSVAIGAYVGAFNFGILLGWSAPTASLIAEQHDYYFYVSSNQFSWIAAMMALGAALSCVFSGVIRNRIGTKITILIFGIPIIVGWAMITIPINPAMLMIGRLLCGVSAGCYSYNLPIYVGEISSKEIRGSMLGMFQVTLNSGVLFVFILGHFASLLILNIVCGSISVLYSLAFIFLPESPVYLVSQDRYDDAKKSLRILRGDVHNIEVEIVLLKLKNEERKSQRKTFSEVFVTKSTKKAFIIILLQFMFFQMSGINVVLFYATKIFTDAGIKIEPGIASIIIASVQVPSALLSVSLVDRFGRKILLMTSHFLMFLGLIGIGTFFVLAASGTSDGTPNKLSWLPITSLCIFVFAFAVGVGPVSYVLLGELFLQEAKAYVAPIGVTLNFSLTFTISLTFVMLSDAIGIGQTFFMFSGFCALGLLFTIFVIPETKEKTTEEIQKLFN